MKKKVISFGEVLWDLLPDGPVVGGAPFNFIYRIAALGHEGLMISAVGQDDLGNEAIRFLEDKGIKTMYLQRQAGYPTGTVNVFLDENRQPDYEIVQNVAYDYIAYNDDLEALSTGVDCICFGTLAQRNVVSRETLSNVFSRLEKGGTVWKLLDINLRKHCFNGENIRHSLRQANILKLNDDEAFQLAGILGFSGSDLVEIADILLGEWSLEHCVITLGARGAFCVSAGGMRIYDPGYDIEMIDPLGSGDAFAAGFVDRLLNGKSAREGCRFGNILGAIVATQRGATQPILPAQIEQFLNELPGRNCEPGLEFFFHQDYDNLLWKT